MIRLLILVGGLSLPPPAFSQSVVISQVYGAGGNAGAVIHADYVELFNRSAGSVALNGYSLQYTSADGNSWGSQIVNLPGVALQPGQYFLVQIGSAGASGAALPSPDFVDTSFGMGAAAGKILLSSSAASLTGENCPSSPAVIDLAPYGAGTTCAPRAPAPSTTQAIFRAGAGCVWTGNPSTDFSAAAPRPRNTASPFNPCGAPLRITSTSPLPGGVLNQSYSFLFQASGGSGVYRWAAVPPGSAPFGLTLSPAGLLSGTLNAIGEGSFTVEVADSNGVATSGAFRLTVQAASCNVTHTIGQIQGSGIVSPLENGAQVITRGIVTARRFNNGFFLQMAEGDGDANTSDGIFVFTGTAPPAVAAVGNDVCVSGAVLEFIPPGDPFSPSLTEITSPQVTLLGSGNGLPVHVTLTAADTPPDGGMHLLERYEGMRVHIPSLTVVGPTGGTKNEPQAISTSTGVFYAVMEGIARPFREAGISVVDALPDGSPSEVPRFDGNPERIRVASRGQVDAAPIDVSVGQTVAEITGVLDYAFRTYSLLPDPMSQPLVSGTLDATPIPEPEEGELTVATFNIERFFDTENDPATSDAVLTPEGFERRLRKASEAIRTILRTPDVLALVEVENLSTLETLAQRINQDAAAAGQPNPNYAVYLSEGNDPSGIDVGFLVKRPKVSVLVVVQHGKSETYVDPNTGLPALLNDRPPLLLRGMASRPGSSTGLPFTVIASHIRSLTGIDDPGDGNRVRTKRRAQAEFLAKLIQARQQSDPNELILAAGDFNAFPLSDGYVDVIGTILGTPAAAETVVLASPDLVNPDLTNLIELLPEQERYTYVFDGNAQALDHILVNAPAREHVTRVAVARMNADLPEIRRGDDTGPDRLSDHDAVVAYLRLTDPAGNSEAGWTTRLQCRTCAVPPPYAVAGDPGAVALSMRTNRFKIKIDPKNP